MPEIRAADGLDSGGWIDVGLGEVKKRAFKFNEPRVMNVESAYGIVTI